MRSSPDGPELQRIYSARFAGKTDYRTRVWRVLASFFGQWSPSTGTVLDLGAGYCEFINNAAAGVKYAMDLNGYFGGPVRLPLLGSDADTKAEIERLMADIRN